MRMFLLFLLFPIFLLAQAPAGTAEMKINEVLYLQTVHGLSNDEFIEFYVTQSGDIKNYIFTDQDSSTGHRYSFPSQSVNRGDYVVLHVGDGTNNHNNNVYHFYMKMSQILNNVGGDDILLLKPDDNDTTNLGGTVVQAIPFDFVQYGTSGSAIDTIPTSENGITVSWNVGENSRLIDADKGTSISLTPNSNDSDSSVCWEKSATTIASEKATNCPHYTPTLDTNSNATLTYSMGETNTALPDIKLTKSSVTLYDPINKENNPKAIPGAYVKYTIHAQNEGLGKTDRDTIAIVDGVPDNMKLCVEDSGQCHNVEFVDGGVSSALSLGVGDVEYSDDGGNDFNHTTIADAEGFDEDVTHVRVKLGGSFKESDGTNHPSFDIKLYMGVK